MVICLSSDLPKVGHTEDLMMLTQRSQELANRLCNAAADADVDFIKYKGSGSFIANAGDLNGKADSG